MPTKTSKHDAYSLVTIRPILRTKHQQQHHVHFPLVCQGWTLPFHQGLNGSMHPAQMVPCSEEAHQGGSPLLKWDEHQ